MIDMVNKGKCLALAATAILAVTGLGTVAIAIAPTTAAAAGSCSPAMGHSVLRWVWAPPAGGVPGAVIFSSVTGEVFEIGPYPTSVNAVDQKWTLIDDTAPIVWFAKNVPGAYTVIDQLFTGCQPWSSQAVAAMNAQHFAPSQIGGVNPPGITSSTPSSGGSTSTPSGSGGTATASVTITVNASPVNYYVGGNLATPANGLYDNQGVVKVSDSLVYDKTTYVPIRFAAELLGQPVAWNAAEHGVDITVSSAATSPPASTTRLRAPAKAKTMRITVDETPMQFYVGGVSKTPAGGKFNNQGVVVPDGFIYDQTSYIPIRLAAEILSVPISWDSKRYAVAIGQPTTGATVKTGGTRAAIAGTAGPAAPPIETSPPPGSAARAAKIIKQDNEEYAAGPSNPEALAAPSRGLWAIVAGVVALAIVAAWLVRRAQRRALYRL